MAANLKPPIPRRRSDGDDVSLAETTASGFVVQPEVAHAETARTPAPGAAEGDELAAQTQASSFQGTERYEVITLLGQGGMGAVYEVFDRRRERRVALKVLRDPER